MTARPHLLLVVDESIRVDEAVAIAEGYAVDLFSLTGNWLFIQRLERSLQGVGAEVRVLPSAQLVDDEVARLRTLLPELTDRIGEAPFEGHTVRDALRLPELETSAFWFGAIAERNPFKTRELFLIAVVRALDRQLGASGYTRLSVAAAWPLAREAIQGLGRARAVTVVRTATRATLRGRVAALGSHGRVRTQLEALAVLARQVVWSVLARGLTLGSDVRPTGAPPLLFVTYFPYVDRPAAAEGRFVNRYAGPLPELLRSVQRPIWWAALFVFVDGWRFRDAVSLARRFARHGERLALLDAYFTPREWCRVVSQAWRLSRVAQRIERLAISIAVGTVVPRGADAVVRQLWRGSYAGPDLVRGLYYLAVFRRLLSDASAAPTVLYYAEFQAWEQALNAVRIARRSDMRAVAFQHTAFSQNHYFYFRTAQEVGTHGSGASMPLPSLVAASGRLPGERLAARLPVEVVESIRQMHLADVLSARSQVEEAGSRTLLVVGSIDRHETRAMLTLIAAAFPFAGSRRIRIKAHPSMPVEPLLAELDIDPSAAGYDVVGGSASDWLPQSALVLVGSSAVAVEALAYGCEVIVPVFASSPCLTPLGGFECFYRVVHSPDELVSVVDDFEANGPVKSAAEKRDLVRAYWTTDRALPRWRSLLALDEPAAETA